MKNLILLLVLTFTVSCCNKNDDDQPKTELEKLPPATQIGADTFGCLLDGVAFTPDRINNHFQCYYQIVDGEYYFHIRGTRNTSSTTSSTIFVVSGKKQIFQSETYDLYEYIYGNVTGSISSSIYANGVTTVSTGDTSHTYTGKLKITKLDPINYIVSGTFYFDVMDNQGKIHHITDGRFDTHYTN